jgi:Dicarboxylate transport
MKFSANKRLLWMFAPVAVLVLTATAVPFILPAYVASRLIPGLAAEFGLAPKTVHVGRVGWWGADLGPLQLQGRGLPVLTLASVQIDYTPLTLLRGRIQGVTLGGLELDLTVSGKRVSIPGLRLPVSKPSQAAAPTQIKLDHLMPVQLDHVDLIQSRLVFNRDGRKYVVPVDIRLQTAELDRGILKGQVRCLVMDNSIVFQAVLDQPSNSVALQIDGQHLVLDSFCRTGLLPADLSVSGVLDLKGRGSLRLNPLSLTGLAISGRLKAARLAAAWGVLQNLSTAQGDPRPIELTVGADAPGHFMWTCGPFELDGPFKAVVQTLQGGLTPAGSGWSLNGQVEALVPGQTLASGLVLEKALPMTWTIKGAQNAGKDLRCKIQSAGSQPLVVGLPPFRFTPERYAVDLDGRYGQAGIEADAALSFEGLHLALPSGAVTAQELKISGTLATAPPAGPSPMRLTAQASLDQVRAQLGTATVTLPEVRLHMRGQGQRGRPWESEGRLRITGAKAQDQSHKIAAQGLSVDLPLAWPAAKPSPAGRLDLQSVRWDTRKLGAVQGTLRQNGRGIEMSLTHRSQLLDHLIVRIKGRLDEDGIHAQVSMPPYQPDRAVDLGRFVPAATGWQAAGRLEAHATLALVQGQPLLTRALITIDQGMLTQPARQLKLDGLAMDLQIKDLAALRSAAHQKLRVENLQMGKLAAQKLDVDFQLEDSRSLFVEKAGLQWCRGRINAAAVRIVPDKADYDVTLFCDRLNLAMVLEQLGAAQASGEGAVNGRIPVRWTDGRLSFDNGFLYSTPGQSGVIKLTGTEVLLSGLPPDSPQHTQLDIATEALKDYTYQWAKLSVQSQKDILLLKLQLDGKPNRLLPFAYNQALGQLARVNGEGQAEFKGIGIDLNFKSPLNEIIRYKSLLKRN